MHTKTNRIVFSGLLIACFLLSSNLTTNSASAASASITTNSSITLDTSSAGNGVSIDEESINVTTTCTKGYDLTIATSTSTNLYLNGDSTKTAAYTAVDGTSALDSTNNTNKWGYTLTNNATASTVFSPLSTTASSIRTISQTTDVTSETIPIYYGIKTDNTVNPGAYSMGNNGTIIYYLTMNPLCNVVDIAYDGNNADAGTMGAAGTGVIHTGVKDGDTVNLIASNFSRNGYGFAGWSLDQDAGTKLLDNDNTNNPIVYGPQETITLPDGFAANDTDNDGIVKLYAVWLQSQGNLQGWMGCSNLDTATYDSTTGALDLTKNSVTALTDQRDNDTYAVARLADGNCWMIENLRLEADATRGNNRYDPSVANEFLAQGYGTSDTYGNFSGLADAESTGFTSTYTANSLYYRGTQEGTASIDIGTSNYPAYRMPRYNNWNNQSTSANRPQDPTTNSATNSTTNAGMYSYGNYYTWHAAIADLTYNGTNNQSTTGTSLCPTGWHLPTGGLAYASGGTSGVNVTGDTGTFREFYNLGYKTMDEVKTAYEDTPNSGYAYYSSNTTNTANKTAIQAFRSFPNNFLYSGYFYTSSANDRGSGGYYWSSTAYSLNSSYSLSLDSSLVSPGTGYYNKYLGLSIRCTASDPQTYTLSYDGNGGSGAPASQTTTANGIANFTLSITTPTRSGYTFAGWTDEAGNEAGPGDTFTTKDPNTTLYAIWTNNSCNPTATTIGTGNTTTDAVCLQDVTPSMKSSLPTADATTGTYSLIDARDNQSYTVAKLADGNLWLTKNLNYGSSSDTLLTSHDTDLPSNRAFKAPASTTAFETINNDTTYISPKTLTDSTYGGYYSFAAAIASTDAYSISNQNITTSICPKGWDLPTSSIYNHLRTASGNTSYATMSAAPYSFKYAGYRNGTSFSGQTSSLRLWTSTNYNSSTAYYTTAYGTASYSGNYKRYGESARCIASNGTVTINYEGNGTTEYPVTGTVASQTNVDINSTNTQPDTGFTRTGWAFNGWNTAADGSGTVIVANTTITNLNPAPGSTITLYAQWSPALTINFNSNGGSGTMTSQLIPENTSKALKNNSFTAPSGNYFIGWMTEESRANNEVVYANGATYTTPTTVTPGDSITLYAKWGPRYTIVYNGNNPTGGSMVSSGTELKHTNINEGRTVNLYAPNYWKTGSSFVGWSPNPNATVGGTDPIYGPNESISAPSYDTYGQEISGTKTITLYAIWQEADSTKTMQTFTAADCQNLSQTTFNSSTGKITAPAGSVIALKDQRDNNVYTVARLADGKCWMTENLRLEAENTVGNNQYDESVTNQSLSQHYGGVFAGLDSSENANFSSTTTATPNNLYNSTNITGSFLVYRFPRYNNNNTKTSLTASYNGTGSSTYYSWYSYGNYYTWAAAMANTTYYDSSTGTSGSESAGTSICPTNWTLPTSGTTTKDFGTLSRSYDGSGENQSVTSTGDIMSNRFRSFPNNFLYSGYFNGSSANGRGSLGRYWSRSAYNSSNSYYLYLSSMDLFPSYYDDKYDGYSVRCLIGS